MDAWAAHDYLDTVGCFGGKGIVVVGGKGDDPNRWCIHSPCLGALRLPGVSPVVGQEVGISVLAS